MQCLKLINGGQVDKVLVFDTLPERLLTGVKTWGIAGFPRSWGKWLTEIGSTRTTFKTTTKKVGPGDYEYKSDPIGKEPCFYRLDYVDLNSDKDKWREICEYVRVNIEDRGSLKEKIENMAVKLAEDSYKALEIEPEDVPVIKVKNNDVIVLKDDDIIVENDATVIAPIALKRRGRTKKNLVEA